MSCLAHDKHYCSSFHAVINELRLNKSVHNAILRQATKKCCTCHTDVDQPVTIEVKERSKKLQTLVDRVNQNGTNNAKLVSSFNRLENLIESNRIIPPEPVKKEETVSSNDENSPLIDAPVPQRAARRATAKPIPKKNKPIRQGTLLFLPYHFVDNNLPLEQAKTRQRGRFLSRKGLMATLETEHAAFINLVTPETSEAVRESIEMAKKGLNNFQIVSPPSEPSEDGEWVLIRAKKVPGEQPKTDFTELIAVLKNRWESFFNSQEATIDDLSEEGEDISD